MSCIDFYYENNKYIARIRKDNNTFCYVKSKNNVKVLKELLAKRKIYTGGEAKTIYNVDDVIKAFDRHMTALRKMKKATKPLRILNEVNDDMKISKKNPVIGKTIVVASLATVIGFSSIAIANRENTDDNPIVEEEQIVYYEEDNTIQNRPLPTIVPRNEESLKPEIDTDELLEMAKELVEENKVSSNEELNSMLIEEKASDEFHFSYDDRSSSSALDRTKLYEDIFEKYAKRYGLDTDLLMAMASQESSGKHYENLPSGSAYGIMQIENVNLNSTIKAYNFEEGKVDKFHITKDNVKDLDTNIRIGAMMLRERLDTYNNNIPLAIQSYNYGSGNLSKALKMCVNTEGVSKNSIINNPLYQDWMKYRAKAVRNGDSKYIEHVFSYLPINHEIKVKSKDGNNVVIKIVNDNVKANQMT